MLSVRASNLPERLLAALVRDVAALDAGRATVERLFEPPALLVPNHEASRVLLRALADAHGAVANLPCHFLERWLAGVVERQAPGQRLLDRRGLLAFLLTFLCDDDRLAAPALAPVRAYIDGGHAAASATERAGAQRRRLQLAERLAQLFDDYLCHRPDLCEALTGPARALAARGPEAVWQAHIFAAVLGQHPDSLRALHQQKAGVRYITLREFLGETPVDSLRLPGHVFVHAPGPLSRVHAEAIAHLSRACTMHLYQLHPCAELVQTRERPAHPGRARAVLELPFERDDPLSLERPDDPPALGAWGGAPRESLHQLARVATVDHFVPDFAVRAGDNLLTAFQASIAERTAAPTRAAAQDGRQEPDGSIEVWSCPGQRREVEAIAARIWQLVEQSARGADPLRFHDFALLLPAAVATQYHPHIASVFAEAQLPYRITGASLSRENRVVDALLRLIALPASAFTRKDVLAVLLHPLVLAALPGVHAHEVVSLVERLGIIFGADRGDHEGTYIDGDLWNWEQGLRRLALAAFASGPDEGDERPVASPAGAYLPADLAGHEREWALELGRLLRRLLGEARALRGGDRGMTDWLHAWQRLIGEVIVPDSDEDRRALDACQAALVSLRELPLPDSLPYPLASELARGALESLTTTRSSEASEGITLATVAAARARPFRVVFLAGLGAGQFPAPERKDELDLRRDRRAGEPSARALDRGFFLEALTNARDAVVLSYVGREAGSGEPLEPSSVVSELERFIADGHGPVARVSVPLHRHEDEGAGAVFDACARDRLARALGQELRQQSQGADPDSLLARLDTQTRQGLAALLGPSAVGAVHPRAESESESVPASRAIFELEAVRRFLECPLQGSARVRLSLRAEDDDEAESLALEDEPVTTPTREAAALLRRCFLLALGTARGQGRIVPNADELHEAHETVMRGARMRGLSPVGPFGVVDRERQLRLLAAWATDLDTIAPGLRGPHRLIAWGGTRRPEPLDQLAPAIRLPPSPRRPEGAPLAGPLDVHHGSEILFDAHDGSVVSLVLDTRARRSRLAGLRETNLRLALRGYLDHLALAAAAPEVSARHRVVVAQQRLGAGEPFVHELAPLSTAYARARLRDLVDELAGDNHDYFLPCEIVFAHHAAPARPIADLVAARLETPFRATRSRFGPVPDGERYPPPAEASARAMIRARFADFLDLPHLFSV